MIQDGKPESLAPKSRILYSLLLILFLVGFVPLTYNAYVLITTNKEEQISYVKELQNEMLSNVAAMTEAYLRSYRAKLEDMAQSYTMILSYMTNGNPFDTELNAQLLSERIKADTNIMRLGSISLNLDGRYAGHVFVDTVIERYQREGAERARQGAFYASPPYYFKPMREVFVVMAAPVTLMPETPASPGPSSAADEKREVKGIVFAVVSLNRLQVRLSENIKRGLTLFVLTEKNRLVAHTDLDRLADPDAEGATADFSAHPLVKKFDELQRVTSITPPPYEVTEAGATTEYIGTAMPVPGNWGWAVFGQSDIDKAYAPVWLMTTKSVSTVAIALAVAVIFGVVFGLPMSQQIRILSDGALRLARGDYAQKIDPKDFKARTELGQLATVFNYMAGEIQERERRLRDAAEENRELFVGTIRTLAAAIDAKDPYTRGHSERVTYYTVAIAEELLLTPDEVERMRISALLHDVGKIGIDDTILRKPGALTDEEYEIMKGHPQKGAEIMHPIRQMRPFIDGIRFHHETLAGTGYPLGLKSDQIPLPALIIQVADTFDAMTTDRPYQKGMDVESALDRIQSFVGKRYDQQVVNALKSAVAKGKTLPGLKRRGVEV